VVAQLPAEQRWPDGQTFPQPPQLRSSERGSTQRPEQRLSLAMQLTAQTPSPLHTSPEGQASPQAPQLLESRERLAQ
jgi:hypothetical protein